MPPPPEPASPLARPMPAWTESLDLRSLAATYGSPLYLHHPATLRAAFESYASIVGAAGVRYPVKANPSPLVLEAIARWGGGADCASRPEVQAALSAGVPMSRISYNTPSANLDHAVWLLRQGATVVADSPGMVSAIEDRISPEAMLGRLFVRVNPGRLPGYLASGEHQRYTAHGDPRSQFGIPSEDLLGVLGATRLPVSGLHIHVGTMMDNLAAFVDGLAFLHELVDRVRTETSHRPDTINLGGGLGLPHDRSQVHPSIEALGTALREHLRADRFYEVEPGNSLVGDSFALLTRLVAVKDTRGRRWGICDVGTDQLVKHTVAGWRHEIVDADHRPLPSDGPDALAGPLCFAGDVLLPTTSLAAARAGDPLLVRQTGAYCEAIASRFNGRIGPATAIVESNGSVRVARHREDPFLASEGTAMRPIVGGHEMPTVLPSARITDLQSPYMHRDACSDTYTLGEARRIAPSTYEFEVDVEAPCGFIGLPLAVRILGDASIVAVGLELGWERKQGAVLASRMTITATTLLPGRGRFPCRVAVGTLHPSSGSSSQVTGTVRFEFGEGCEIHGTALVSAPAN
ncbi:MAG: hypothetical protein RL487_1511 [Actinomycetota bacterium]